MLVAHLTRISGLSRLPVQRPNGASIECDLVTIALKLRKAPATRTLDRVRRGCRARLFNGTGRKRTVVPPAVAANRLKASLRGRPFTRLRSPTIPMGRPAHGLPGATRCRRPLMAAPGPPTRRKRFQAMQNAGGSGTARAFAKVGGASVKVGQPFPQTGWRGYRSRRGGTVATGGSPRPGGAAQGRRR